MQDAPVAIGTPALRTGRRAHPFEEVLLAWALSGTFFAVAAGGLGVFLHVIGVMPLLP
ncbi:MAG TPA: hypothetical protein VIG76_03165 [Amnibacterium sp.]|jgi:hypothetical protein|uniref:hypothetical protein n=1 Tax=Amnibacterium sp. TaxID=1872496 RepID=UPI002F95595F